MMRTDLYLASLLLTLKHLQAMSLCIAQKNGLIKVIELKGITHIVMNTPFSHAKILRMNLQFVLSTFLGDDLKAKKMSEKVRVLCWVMTAPENHDKKAKHVKATWGKRCNILLFMSTAEGIMIIANCLFSFVFLSHYHLELKC